MNLKAAIYDPYLDTLGGGERYCLTVGEILLENDYQVDLFWPGRSDLISQAEKRFNLDLKGINLVPDIFSLSHQKVDLIEDNNPENYQPKNYSSSGFISKIQSNLKKYRALAKYDLIFYLSDGSFPFLFARQNFLHVQVPFVIRQSSRDQIINRLKSLFISKVVCNSQFTSKFFTTVPENKIQILYPPVDVEKFSSSEKKSNIILSVGRFDNILNAKKQDVLITSFKNLITSKSLSDWKLILMGGSHDAPEKNHYLCHLQDLAKGLPIEFIINPDFDQLRQVYSTAKIYWHAAGYGVDEINHPEETEHFGMAVVEAMASGAIPMVIAKGGLTEIVKNGENGYLWQSVEDLVSKTKQLISSPETIGKMSRNSIKTSANFSKSRFAHDLLSLIHQ